MVSRNTQWIEVLRIEKQKKTYKEVRIFSVNKQTGLVEYLKMLLESHYLASKRKKSDH